MDKVYADAVRWLPAAAPEVFANDVFAIKGGTALRSLGRGRLAANSPSDGCALSRVGA